MIPSWGALRLSGAAFVALAGVLVGAMAVVALWKPWRKQPAVARVEMVEPMPRWEPPPRVAVQPAPSPRSEDFRDGPEVCVETIVAETEEADEEVRERFALEDDEPILNLRDFPRFPWGGDLVETERDGRTEITMRAFKAPWIDLSWRHDVTYSYLRFGESGELASYGYEPVEIRIKERLRLYPSVGRFEIPNLGIEDEYFGITGKLSLGPRDRR